jgi:hypothetical protein
MENVIYPIAAAANFNLPSAQNAVQAIAQAQASPSLPTTFVAPVAAPVTVATPPAPTPADHAKLHSFLTILERLGVIALTLAPAVAAPFVKNPNSVAILSAETPIAQSLAGALTQSLGQ